MTRAIAAAGLLSAFFWSSAAETPRQNWALSSTETIWRSRYTNCDKGYYVDLPPSVVAHATRPPSPNHGLVISASNPATTDQVTVGAGRTVEVRDEYNVLRATSPRAQLNWELRQTPGANVKGSRSVRFLGLPAVEASNRFDTNGEPQIIRELIVLRKADDLVYSLRLVTNPLNYPRDAALYEQVRNGFHIFRVSNGECVNP